MQRSPISVFIFVIEDVIVYSSVAVGTEYKSDDSIHTYHSRTAGTQERQRNTDNRSYFQHHTDIHDTMGKYKSESSHANEFSQMIAAYTAVAEYFKAYISEDYYQSQRAYKSEDLSCIGEYEVVVYLRNCDIVIRLSENSFSENSA